MHLDTNVTDETGENKQSIAASAFTSGRANTRAPSRVPSCSTQTLTGKRGFMTAFGVQASLDVLCVVWST